jgi:hypothetical protein
LLLGRAARSAAGVLRSVLRPSQFSYELLLSRPLALGRPVHSFAAGREERAPVSCVHSVSSHPYYQLLICRQDNPAQLADKVALAQPGSPLFTRHYVEQQAQPGQAALSEAAGGAGDF